MRSLGFLKRNFKEFKNILTLYYSLVSPHLEDCYIYNIDIFRIDEKVQKNFTS